MSTKVLDISYWQGNVDFKKIKSAGYSYIVLRAGYGTTVDSKFYSYAKSCVNNGIKIGVYWFCYSTSVSEVKSEAKKCINTIKAYSIDLPVFFDFEYDTVNKAKKKGISLGKNECSKFTIAFCEEIKKAGYTPGYYANLDYYKNMYTDEVKQKGYAFWLAHYTTNKTYHEPPISCDFFQYSDAGKVPGIGGSSVDMDVCLNDKYLDCKKKEGEGTMSKTDAINAMIAVAENEVGYLEKKSNSQLDSKTGNAGYNNYTKYWRDVYKQYMGQPWCACWVSWVFMKTFGLETAKKLLKHWPYVYCPTLGNLFTKHANPQVGDIVIFWRGGTFAHTGIVTKVQGDKFWTIEGNASSAAGITPNGGAVVKKSYYNSQLPGTKFCRPDYSIVTKTNSVAPVNPTPTNVKTYLELGDTGSEVKELQKKLNQLGYKGKDGKKLVEDGSFGANTDFAVRAFQKAQKLVVDGQAGKNTMTALNAAVASNTKPQTPSNGLVGEVTASELNVRSWAGSENPTIKSYPKLSRGNRIRVLSSLKASDGSTWYKIAINNTITKNKDVIGFVAAKYIKKV